MYLDVNWLRIASLGCFGAAGFFLYLILQEEEFVFDASKGSVSSRQTRVSVKIPKECVKTVVGKNGTTLREIEANTNTRIKFKDDEETESFKTAEIRGTSQGAYSAQLKIIEIIYNQPKIVIEKINVPDFSISAIIGRDGDVIRDIQKKSKCPLCL